MKTEMYFHLFTDAWRHFRKYAEQIPLIDDAWEQEVGEALSFVDSHPDQRRLARKLITALEDELEQLDMERKATK